MTLGTMGTDREQRIDYAKMREWRMKRAQQMMEKHGIGCMVIHDGFDARYVSGAYITTPTRWPELSFVVLPRNGQPHLFGGPKIAGVEYMEEIMPWLKGTIHPIPFHLMGKAGREQDNPDEMEGFVKLVADIMAENGLSNEPVGLDGTTNELTYAAAFQKAGIKAVHGQRPMYEARMIKCQEEIECIRMACSNAEAAFSEIVHAIRPGVTECELVGIGQKKLYEKGADMAWEFVCSSGNRTNPLSIDYTDRSIRPHDLVIVDINGNCFNGYMTCYYNTFSCGKPTPLQEEIFEICTTFLQETIKNMRAGRRIADVHENIATGTEKFHGWDIKKYGWSSWSEPMAPAFGHGIGITLHEIPWVGMGAQAVGDMKFEENMVIAMENWFGYKGGYDGVRLESMVVIHDGEPEYLDRWPKDKLVECSL